MLDGIVAVGLDTTGPLSGRCHIVEIDALQSRGGGSFVLTIAEDELRQRPGLSVERENASPDRRRRNQVVDVRRAARRPPFRTYGR